MTYGDPAGTVTVRSAIDGERLTIEVHNRGPVIPPEHLPRLFDAMTRGDAQRRGAGRRPRPLHRPRDRPRARRRRERALLRGGRNDDHGRPAGSGRPDLRKPGESTPTTCPVRQCAAGEQRNRASAARAGCRRSRATLPGRIALTRMPQGPSSTRQRASSGRRRPSSLDGVGRRASGVAGRARDRPHRDHAGPCARRASAAAPRGARSGTGCAG